MVFPLIFAVLYIWSVASVGGNDNREAIRRIDVFGSLVIVGRTNSIRIFRYSEDATDSPEEVARVPLKSTSKLLHLKLINESTVTYCDKNSCWLCSQRSANYLCQEFDFSRGQRDAVSVECLITSGDTLIVRFVDSNGFASLIKLKVPGVFTSSPVLPSSQADDSDTDKNQTLVGSFRSRNFTYFIGSASRYNQPKCLLIKDPQKCFEAKNIRENVRVTRVCDEDLSKNLETRMDLTLSCGTDVPAPNIALAATYQLPILTVAFGSSSSSLASVCQFDVESLEDEFERTWKNCLKMTNSTDCSRSPFSPNYPEVCQTTVKGFRGGYSACQRFLNNSSPVDMCSVGKYSGAGWIENFAPNLDLGSVYLSFDKSENVLISMTEDSASSSLFVLSKFPNGSAQLDRKRVGNFIGTSFPTSFNLLSLNDVDPVPVIHSSNSLFFNRNNSVQIKSITCKGLYTACEQLPFLYEELGHDQLDCVWCEPENGLPFSLSRKDKNCQKGRLYVDSCKEYIPSRPTASSVTKTTQPATVTITEERTSVLPTDAPQERSNLVLSVIIVVLFIVVTLVTFLVIRFLLRKYRVRKQKNAPVVVELDQDVRRNCVGSSTFFLPSSHPLIHPSSPQIYYPFSPYCSLLDQFPQEKLIKYSKLALDSQPIGRGHYGEVYKGEYEVAGQKIVVACKKLHDEEKSSTEEFMMEARAMATLDHPRVLEFVGIFFDKVYHARPTILVTKFMLHGDLANYLRDPSTHIILAQIFNFCLEAAEGMQYVHSKGIIHRDLAARNCMLDENFHVCIADFGLSRFADVEDDGYEVRTLRELPLPMLSIEAMEGHFSFKSDVWAFGNLAWEISTRGHTPWKAVCREELISTLRRGIRLPKTDFINDSIYRQVMLPCWDEAVERRPSFDEIIVELQKIVDRLQYEFKARLNHSYEMVVPCRD
ncbi:hypothetical protein L596_007007 [Steinernema carpocapsae]|uniref:receptor protein-tyrosine kinase n=1 Tax=Steinernema carpocapsae TaxID=34508 RepID=A0A4U5P8M5_STECR|nr:hypothetical protein L596_007007 [Steinernema carpocapsae]